MIHQDRRSIYVINYSLYSNLRILVKHINESYSIHALKGVDKYEYSSSYSSADSVAHDEPFPLLRFVVIEIMSLIRR
jgi:hypothetical protein